MQKPLLQCEKNRQKLAEVKPNFLEVEASQIEYCDGSGIGLLEKDLREKL